MSHLRDSEAVDAIRNNESDGIVNTNRERTGALALDVLATPGRSQRKRSPKKYDEYYVGKRQKRESDASFFRSVGYDPVIRSGNSASRPVLLTLDGNLPSASAPHQEPVKDNALVTPDAEEIGGVSDLALELEPVNLAAGVNPTDENGDAFRRPTKQSFLHESRIYEKWAQPNGKTFHKRLEGALKDENERDGSNGTTSQRGINTAKLAPAVWDMTTFLYTTRMKKTRAKALVRSIFRELAEGNPEVFRDALVKESSCYLRREVFQAWKFQRAIDVFANGGLNYECLNTMRAGVEGLRKSERGVIPSGSTVARCAKELECHGALEYGLQILDSTTKHGPSLTFDFDTVVGMLVKAHGLQEFAKAGSNEKPVLFSFTLDGAQLTNQLGHVTAGIKIVDPRAKDPLTSLPICLYQSRDLCLPLQITFGKDCKALYKDCFSAFFAYFKAGINIKASNGDTLSNFDCNSPQDLSSAWKACGMGSGAYQKGARLPCHICMCHRDSLSVHKTGDDRCEPCLRLKLDQCFCQPVCDEEYLDTRREQIQAHVTEALDDGYKQLDCIAKKSKLLTNPTQANRLTHPSHIQYEPKTLQDKKAFMLLLKEELRLRLSSDPAKFNESLGSSLEDRRASLQDLVNHEADVQLARTTVDRHDTVRQMADKLLIEDCIPCLLHLEMRTNEKLFWSLLQQADDRYLEGDNETRNKFFSQVQQCIQTQVLGDESTKRVSQWQLPVVDGKIQPKTMTNVTSRKCILGLRPLVDVVFSLELDERSLTPQHCRQENERRRDEWHALLDTYVPMMDLLRKKEDFTATEIDNVHVLTTTFMSKWIGLMRGQSVTNYIHIIGSGHLQCYLQKFGNLCRYSQQGWEALNQKLKHFYFNNANHGGCGGNSNGNMLTNDHVKPLMRMCQRFLLWKLGLGDRYFLTKLKQMKTAAQATVNDDSDEEGDAEEFDNPHAL